MTSLQVKLLHPDAQLPTINHVGEDLGYDIHSIEDVTLLPNVPTKVRTGLAAAFVSDVVSPTTPRYGLIIADRSSMAYKNRIQTSAGVIDAGFRDEISVILTLTVPFRIRDWVRGWLLRRITPTYKIQKGDKIAQMIPQEVLAGRIEQVEQLSASSRGNQAFGSSGR